MLVKLTPTYMEKWHKLTLGRLSGPWEKFMFFMANQTLLDTKILSHYYYMVFIINNNKMKLV